MHPANLFNPRFIIRTKYPLNPINTRFIIRTLIFVNQ